MIHHQKYKLNFYAVFMLILISVSCQKEIKFNSSYAPLKQVINCNFSPETNLYVNISKSKKPNDFNAVKFLDDCKVDLYENDIFVETMQYRLRDTLSGLGWYVSNYKLKPAKTYKIISEHPTLGIASAQEYLPSKPIFTDTLLQHADSINPAKKGKYTITFTDSSNFTDYYFTTVYYKILKPVIEENGDTTYKTDYLWNVPTTSPDAPNPTSFSRNFFNDVNFAGQTKSITFDFNSIYNTSYKKIELVIVFSKCGFNFYGISMQQLRPITNNLNNIDDEPVNLVSNIVNGYGHFSSNSESSKTIRIR